VSLQLLHHVASNQLYERKPQTVWVTAAQLDSVSTISCCSLQVVAVARQVACRLASPLHGRQMSCMSRLPMGYARIKWTSIRSYNN